MSFSLQPPQEEWLMAGTDLTVSRHLDGMMDCHVHHG